MIEALQAHGVDIWFQESPAQTWPSWLANLAPLILLGVFWFFMIRQMQPAFRRRSTASLYAPAGIQIPLWRVTSVP